MKVIILAPYFPFGKSPATGLGATNKIRQVLEMFLEQGCSVSLVDSSHSDEKKQPPTKLDVKVGDRSFSYVRPATYSKRPLGKLRNLTEARSCLRIIAESDFDLIWVYNGYAFEGILARCILRNCRAKVVIEIEDWPFSRKRGYFSLKPLLDFLAMWYVLGRADLATLVNSNIKERLPGERKYLMLPGILKDGAEEMDFEPFTRPVVTIGYFGGLSREKGADILLEAVSELPEGFRFLVCGAGELSSEFEQVAESHQSGLLYKGHVSFAELEVCKKQCDLFINPHSSITEMSDGVFPFKICEYLSKGRLVLSTPLPSSGLDLSPGIVPIEPTASSLLAALPKVREIWKLNSKNVKALGGALKDELSKKAIYAKICDSLQLEA